MDTRPDLIRAARNLVTEHGEAAQAIALERAEHAEASNRWEVAVKWRDIAVAVSVLQERTGR
jgi:hypothetical protein